MQIDINTIIQIVTTVATIAVAFALVQYKTEESRTAIKAIIEDNGRTKDKINTMDRQISKIDDLKCEVTDLRKDTEGIHEEISVINITHGKMEVDIAYIKTSLMRIEQKLDKK